MIGGISPLSSASPVDRATGQSTLPTQDAGTNFLALIGQGLTHVDTSLGGATAKANALASGKDIAIHDVMIAMEQARIDLTLLSEIRNRLVESYQELARMQL